MWKQFAGILLISGGRILGITDEWDDESYLLPKTWTMRHLLTEQNLYGVLFESVTDKLAKIFSVDTSSL